MRKYLRLATILFFCLSFVEPILAQAKSFEILNKNVAQGDVVMIKIFPEWQGSMTCISVFDKQYVPNKYGYVFVGVDVNMVPTGTPEKSDKYQAYLVECGRGVKLDSYIAEIEVLKKEFGTPWYVGPITVPTKAVGERRIKEVALMRTAYGLANKNEDYTSGPFVLPLNNIEVTDTFGTPRLYGPYDRKSKKIRVDKEVPHGGVDLRAKTPLPVVAVNSGKVLLAHNFPLKGTEGNLLVIDHGSGILSLYLHLSKFYVKAGDNVTKGHVVALTGNTPKGVVYIKRKAIPWSTPPHLHLMVKVHGVNIDPLSFIKDYNEHTDR